ncbi:hypothetical protein B0H14DRAFT_2586213 [Mycena olivaceomarginata]|nr:hypothetical protein B0H14DRAFT_2586213 [Mycena olivaceomarginata]
MRKSLLFLLPATSDNRLPLSGHISRPSYFKKLHRRGRNLLRRRPRPVPAPYGLASSGGWGGWGIGPGWGDEPGWGEESEDQYAYLDEITQRVQQDHAMDSRGATGAR